MLLLLSRLFRLIKKTYYCIQGVGRRFAFLVCRKADIDIHLRAGQLSEEEMEKLTTVMLNPQQFKIPNWFLNRQKDIRDGKNQQV